MKQHTHRKNAVFRLLTFAMFCGGVIAQSASASQPFAGPEIGRTFSVKEWYKGRTDWQTGNGPVVMDGNVSIMATYRVNGIADYLPLAKCFPTGTTVQQAYEIEYWGMADFEVHAYTLGDGVNFPMFTDLDIRGRGLAYSGKLYLSATDLSELSRFKTIHGTIEGYDKGEDLWSNFAELNLTYGEVTKTSLGDYLFPLAPGATYTSSTEGCITGRGSINVPDRNLSFSDELTRRDTANFAWEVISLQDFAYAPGKSVATYVISGTAPGIMGDMTNHYSPQFGFPMAQDFGITVPGMGEVRGRIEVVDTELFTSGITTAAAGFSSANTFTVSFYSADSLAPGTLLGTLTFGGGTPVYAPAASGVLGMPTLMRLTGNIPAFQCGQYISVTPENGAPFRVYLPENLSGQYGNDVSFWVQPDGTTLWANDSDGGRSGAPNQTYAAAKQSLDFAATGGSRSTAIRSTAQSNFNFVFNEFCSGQITNTNSLRMLVNAQNGGGANKIVTISRWNSHSNTWQSYLYVTLPPPFNTVFSTGNFGINQGDVLRLETVPGAGQLTLTLEGTKLEMGEAIYNFRPNYAYFGVPSYRMDLDNSAKVFADLLANSTAAVQTVSGWNAVSQTWTEYIDGITGTFVVTPGMPLRTDPMTMGTYRP